MNVYLKNILQICASMVIGAAVGGMGVAAMGAAIGITSAFVAWVVIKAAESAMDDLLEVCEDLSYAITDYVTAPIYKNFFA